MTILKIRFFFICIVNNGNNWTMNERYPFQNSLMHGTFEVHDKLRSETKL